MQEGGKEDEMVTYEQGGKYAYFNGKRYAKDEKTGYYLNSTIRERLHRAVYKFVYGEIPKGFHVHHIDHDKSNNEPENLMLIEKCEHSKLHGSELTNERREALRKNLAKTARPKASEWHKSEAGREWHRTHNAIPKIDVVMNCLYCGKRFETVYHGNNKFCSNACKSAYRRSAGFDDVICKCEICGGEFVANKYAKHRTCSRGCANRFRAREKNRARAV